MEVVPRKRQDAPKGWCKYRGRMYQRGGGSKLLADSGVEAASTCRGVPVGLVPRLFLMEEKSPVTFGGQSRLLPLCHDSCDLQ